MIQFLIYLLLTNLDYNVGTEFHISLDGSTDSVKVEVGLIDDDLSKDVKIQLPIDYSILGSKIYYCSFENTDVINSGICTQLVFSAVGNNSESKLYFIVNDVTRSINKFIIGSTKDEVTSLVDLYKSMSVGISHDMSVKSCVTGISKYKRIDIFKIRNNTIYTDLKLIGVKELSENDKLRIRELDNTYLSLGLDFCLKNSISTKYGTHEVEQITLLSDGNMIIRVNNLNYVFGINIK